MSDALQSTTLRVPLKAYLSSDHLSVATGKTIAVVISKNGAAFGNPSAGATNATEIANGWYYVDLSTTDTATLGPLIVRGTSSGVDDVEPSPYNVVKATNRGMTALPDTACTTNASLLTSGTGTAQLSVAAGLVTVGTNNDKTGYTASTVSDKTGYTLTQTFPTNFSSLGISVAGKINEVVLTDTLTTYTGNTVQTGDAYARIGANGAGLTGVTGVTLAASQHVIVDSGTVTTLTNPSGDTSGTTTLLARLTSTRAGYIDNLSAGAVALASQIPANFTTATFVSAGVFATAALANAPTGGSAPTAVAIRQEMDSNSTKLANLDATITSRGTSTYAGGAVASVTGNVGGSVASVTDKTGFLLGATGLDAIAITDPGGVSGHTTLAKMLVAVYRLFYKKSSKTSTQLFTYADNGTTVNTTQAVSDNGAGTESRGAAV